jgi:hypothetical protein
MSTSKLLAPVVTSIQPPTGDGLKERVDCEMRASPIQDLCLPSRKSIGARFSDNPRVSATVRAVAHFPGSTGCAFGFDQLNGEIPEAG